MGRGKEWDGIFYIGVFRGDIHSYALPSQQHENSASECTKIQTKHLSNEQNLKNAAKKNQKKFKEKPQKIGRIWRL